MTIEADEEMYLTTARIEMEYDALKHGAGDDHELLVNLLNFIRCYHDGNKPDQDALRGVLVAQSILTKEP